METGIRSTESGPAGTIRRMNLSQKLLQLEIAKGYAKRREALANAVGVSKSKLGRWFTGESTPSIHEGLALARELGVTLEYLADDEAEKPVPIAGASLDAQEVLRAWVESGLTRAQAENVLRKTGKMFEPD